MSFFFVPQAFSQFVLDLESGLIFPGYNDIRVPNEGGSDFSFQDDFTTEGGVIPFRARLEFTFNKKNKLYALYAPLRIQYATDALNRPIAFDGAIFSEGLPTTGSYRFNSYRLTYRRDLFENERWLLALGFTAKIRDAAITLENVTSQNDITSRVNDDLGFVPLLHVYASYQAAGNTFFLEADALGARQGRAIDVFLGASRHISPKVEVRAGYRILEGGANVDQVFNFTLVQFASLGLRYHFSPFLKEK
ncbi:hypothetical protein A3SI_16555 [Nitritalea halalkaliphila LW7]|uniref:Outer membrane protein beta-barrel domain-containing protein n=1 Tax=Nitritalea halalkaliphila LW7 TaxID=1189621 RepID=I5BX19_9BACT|nr:hypothetical protein [Nitritalea halalkaliphila]EIM74121.1 hypothetical protein A3SI_16555 [Nitritalea halalkaliphila LW7]